MTVMEDRQWLQDYAERGDEQAFARVVARHLPFVYSSALRQTGNPHQAEEVAQAVFTILARKARTLPAGVVLAGWLFTTTRYAARQLLRDEFRRQRREERFAAMIPPESTTPPPDDSAIAALLDGALASLGQADREAVLIRFFDGKSFAEVAAAMGTSEEAAKKRVQRAVEKLRGCFRRQGVAVTAVALLAALQTASAAPVPATLNAALLSATALKTAAGSAPLSTLAQATVEFMKWTKIKVITTCALATLLAGGLGTYTWKALHPSGAQSGTSAAAPSGGNPNTDWFKDALYGVLMHFLPGDAKGLEMVNQFDVDALAGQLEAIGAKYLVFTMGQYSGYYNAPNAALDKMVGYAPGERCSQRDLPLDLHRALKAKGIKLMLYVTCQVGYGDARAQTAFGLPQGEKEQPLTHDAAEKWAEVIKEWSDRYGDKVSGWWFDGGYPHLGFDDTMAWTYADAAKHGNPKAIVSLSATLGPQRAFEAADFTAGEINDPFTVLPSSRWQDGSQWHVLTYIGNNWAKRDTRFTAEQWADWAAKVAAKGGVVTLDMGPNYDPNAGPIGALAEAQMAQVKAIKAALEKR